MLTIQNQQLTKCNRIKILVWNVFRYQKCWVTVYCELTHLTNNCWTKPEWNLTSFFFLSHTSWKKPHHNNKGSIVTNGSNNSQDWFYYSTFTSNGPECVQKNKHYELLPCKIRWIYSHQGSEYVSEFSPNFERLCCGWQISGTGPRMWMLGMTTRPCRSHALKKFFFF